MAGMEVVELDTTPSPGDQGVQDVLQNLEAHLQMKGTISMIESVGNYMYVSTNAAARDAKQLVKVQDCLFNIIKLNDACSLMMQSFQSGANNILEKLKVAYLYLLDGFPDFAMTDIEAISKDVASMQSAVDKHLKSEKKTAEKIADTQVVVKTELSNLHQKVKNLEEQETKKKKEVAIHGETRNGDRGRDEPETCGGPPVETKTRISKFYLLMLLLVAVKYWYHCRVCEAITEKFDPNTCLLVHSIISTFVLLVLLLRWFIGSQCRNKGNVVLACAVGSLLFGPISPQKDGGLQIWNITPIVGSSMFAEAYSGEQVSQGRQQHSQDMREPSSSGSAGEIWFGSDGSTSHDPQEDSMAPQTKNEGAGSTMETMDPKSIQDDGKDGEKMDGAVDDRRHSSVPDTKPETEKFQRSKARTERKATKKIAADKTPNKGNTPSKHIYERTYTFLESIYQDRSSKIRTCSSSSSECVHQEEASTRTDEQQLGQSPPLIQDNDGQKMDGAVDDRRPSSVPETKLETETFQGSANKEQQLDQESKCSSPIPPPWFLALVLSLSLIATAMATVTRKDLDDSFSGPIVLILQLAVSGCILLLSALAETKTTLEYNGPVDIAGKGFLSSCVLAVVILLCIFGARSKRKLANYDRPGTQLTVHTGQLTPEDLSIAKDELSDIQISLRTAKELLECTEMTDLLFDKSLPYLHGIEEILSKSITLVETWYKECKDVVEPNMGRNIDRAAGIDANDRQRYWNSLQFKQEVVGYYCRWKALQVYCEENRKFIRATRQRIESWYTENLHPREAVAKSWSQAAELDDTDVKAFLMTHGRAGV